MQGPENQTGEQGEQGEQGFQRGGNVTLAQEFIEFLKANKLWWMTPIILVALVLAGVVMLGSTSAAPFIYTLF